MDTINQSEPRSNDVSNLNRESVRIPHTNICFGDLTREEINNVLTTAGASLIPPKSVPFATGGKQRIRRRQKPPGTKGNKSSIATTHSDTIANGVQSQDSTQSSSEQAPVSVAPQPKPKPTSWAALLKPSQTRTQQQGAPTTQMASNQNQQKVSDSADNDLPSSQFTGISTIVNTYQPTFDWTLLEPRGLINNVNTCFVNVILQPLVHCPPFYNLIKTIGQYVAHSFNSKTPLLDSLIEFVNEFKILNESGKPEEAFGAPFAPEYVYDALRGRKRFDSMKGRQEDAEEFLCFLLDGLHEEMIADVPKKEVVKELEEISSTVNEMDGWMEVGPKNRTSTVRTMEVPESPISKIFSGNIRSILRCSGSKDSVTLEPFQSLPLDITPDHVGSVEEALHNMTVPEIMHDYVSSKGLTVDATKQVFLETLPPVLVLHVKRFVYDNIGGVQKLQKPIRYEAELTIKPEWIAAAKRPTEPLKYKLFGVVYHHGVSAGGGHYTCDIRRQNNQWLHLDDTTITEIPESNVVMDDRAAKYNHFTGEQTAYILFYIRA
ncbi:hypothetical protein NQZ79_g1386 [Umbelopsis isabellina]|nr:hypothetical protein NQZ79_g1386 [Umbelopsis isabellina]